MIHLYPIYFLTSKPIFCNRILFISYILKRAPTNAFTLVLHISSWHYKNPICFYRQNICGEKKKSIVFTMYMCAVYHLGVWHANEKMVKNNNWWWVLFRRAHFWFPGRHYESSNDFILSFCTHKHTYTLKTCFSSRLHVFRSKREKCSIPSSICIFYTFFLYPSFSSRWCLFFFSHSKSASQGFTYAIYYCLGFWWHVSPFTIIFFGFYIHLSSSMCVCFT